MKPCSNPVLVAAFLSLTGMANAYTQEASCTQAMSIYQDRDGAARLQFRPTVEAPAVSNTFRLTIGEIALEGIVMWTEDTPRPNGMLMFDCPEGDVTGAEIEACTAWRGVVYAVGTDGASGLLAGEAEAAAASIVMPDLAWSLLSSEALVGAGLTAAPFDIFDYMSCAQ